MPTRAIVTVLFIVAALAPAWAQNAGEADLVAKLSSDAPAAEKDAACKQLKLVGTAASVPALAACLNDEALSLPARQALESMPFGEAGEALTAALTATSGMNRVGVIESVGIRREQRAVPPLIALLSDPDVTTAATAARALGRIGTPEVVEPLKAALQACNPAAADALLRCAPQLPTQQAFDLAGYLYGLDLPEHTRVAAYRAKILAAGDQMLDVAMVGITGVAGISGADRAARVAALGVAASIPGTEATRALAGAFATLEPPVQAALLRALGDRHDPAALEVIAAATASGDATVRLAALRALGQIGDGSNVAMLAKLAATAPDAERDAARDALASMRGAGVSEELVRLLNQAPAAEQAEMARAMAARKAREFAGPLMQMAKLADAPAQIAALKALGALAGDSEAAALIEVMSETGTDAVRDAAEDAVVRVAGRSANKGAILDALLALPAARPEQALAVLTAAARSDFARTLPKLQEAVNSPDAALRGGAVRVLAQYGGPESMGQLLELAGQSTDEGERTLILRGYWRLAEMAAGRSTEEQFEVVRAGLAVSNSDESRKSGIAALADIPLKAALELVQQARADEAVRPEAELAAHNIAARLLFLEPDAAAVLQSLAESATDETLRGKAARMAANLSGASGFVVPWLVSAPYRVEGKQAQDLFDIAFPPEQGGEAEWKLQPPPADPENLWYLDLSTVVGGDHCVVYLKTRVFSEAGGATVAEIGTDDGIKLWVNGELVHANNAVRGFAPGQDKAEVTLKPGWNTFLAKVTQHTLGCAMAVRLPDLPFRVEPK